MVRSRELTVWESLLHGQDRTQLFFHLVDISMLNAYNIWLATHESSPTKKLKLREFVYNVAIQLLERYGQPTRATVGRLPTGFPDRLQGTFDRHFLIYTDKINGKKIARQCYVCRHTKRRPQKRTRVTVICKECDVGLCVGQCFVDFHTLKDFWDVTLLVFWGMWRRWSSRTTPHPSWTHTHTHTRTPF